MWAILKPLLFISLGLFMLYRAYIYARTERFFAAIGALVFSILFAFALYIDFQMSKAEEKAAAPGKVNMTEAKPKAVKKEKKERADVEREERDTPEDFGEPSMDAEPTVDVNEQ
jgi:hypothetical protein